MRETTVESHLRRSIENAGGKCWKFTSPGLIGVPDRVVLLPDGRIWWIETKAPGNKPESPQARRHKELWKLGQKVLILDSVEAVDQFVKGVA